MRPRSVPPRGEWPSSDRARTRCRRAETTCCSGRESGRPGRTGRSRRTFGFRIGSFGLSSFSQRTPAVTVSCGVDEPLVLDEDGELLLRRRPPCPPRSAVSPLRPPNWKILESTFRRAGRRRCSREDVDAAPVALEDLVDGRVVVVGAALDHVVSRGGTSRCRRSDRASPCEVIGRKLDFSEAEPAVPDLGQVRRDRLPAGICSTMYWPFRSFRTTRAVLAVPGSDVGVGLQSLDAVVLARLRSGRRRGAVVSPSYCA